MSTTNASNNFEIGYETGKVQKITDLTKGIKRPAISIWFGPVKTADGIISPKRRMIITDKKTARFSGIILLRNTGSASLA